VENGPGEMAVELRADSTSLRVLSGERGVKPLTDKDRIRSYSPKRFAFCRGISTDTRRAEVPPPIGLSVKKIPFTSANRLRADHRGHSQRTRNDH